jgi:VWFA-related protein
MTVRIAALLSVLLVAAGAATRGPAAAVQATQPPAPRFRSGIDVVEVAVLVKDRAGKPVTDLTRNEITVLENGTPQTLVAFERVSIPARAASPPASVPQAPKDVASNEGPPPARVFVLVLDSHHVAATRVRAVPALARQFIERYIGPGDYAAVFSPGALAAATQDFTTDKARLIAAVDQFTGMKMGSAVVEVERERAAAAGVRGAIPMHAGHDPSDSERTDRAVALASTLEALANHLERISGRRKTLLLFSEGIDYDQADVLGKVQRSANDVMHGMGRAIGALMRTNVALYAVDPRALNSADADLLETPIYNPTAAPTRTVADEQTDSIRTLHSLSESTGGFAAVNRNDFTGAFERIDLESSSYYVIGYAPERPAKAWRVSLDPGQGLAAGRPHQCAERIFGQGRDRDAPARQRLFRKRAGVRIPDGVAARPGPGARADQRTRSLAGDPRPVIPAPGVARQPIAASRSADAAAGSHAPRRRPKVRRPPRGRGAWRRPPLRGARRKIQRTPRTGADDRQRRRAARRTEPRSTSICADT